MSMSLSESMSLLSMSLLRLRRYGPGRVSTNKPYTVNESRSRAALARCSSPGPGGGPPLGRHSSCFRAHSDANGSGQCRRGGFAAFWTRLGPHLFRGPVSQCTLAGDSGDARFREKRLKAIALGRSARSSCLPPLSIGSAVAARRRRAVGVSGRPVLRRRPSIPP